MRVAKYSGPQHTVTKLGLEMRAEPPSPMSWKPWLWHNATVLLNFGLMMQKITCLTFTLSAAQPLLNSESTSMCSPENFASDRP